MKSWYFRIFPLKTGNSALEHPKNALPKRTLFLQNIYPCTSTYNKKGKLIGTMKIHQHHWELQADLAHQFLFIFILRFKLNFVAICKDIGNDSKAPVHALQCRGWNKLCFKFTLFIVQNLSHFLDRNLFIHIENHQIIVCTH